MAPVVGYSGDNVVAEDCSCKDLVKRLDSVLRTSFQAATRKAEEVFRNELNELLSALQVPETTAKPGWSSSSIVKQNPMESRTTAAPPDERIHFALVRAIVLVTVIAIVLISTCKLVLQFVTRTYRITD